MHTTVRNASWTVFLQGRSGVDVGSAPRHPRGAGTLSGTRIDTRFDTRLDTVVVGAGRAGLALGYHLRRAGRRFTIVEATDRIGDSWRRRRDSLTLSTPRRDDGLPGMAFPGPSRGFPGKDEMADYLETYASRFRLPVEPGSPVTSARRDVSNGFAVETGRLELSARQVVVAAGSGVPALPRFAPRLDPRISQLHSDAYRSPASVPQERVVVVGEGRTAAEIAQELAAAGRHVSLSAPGIAGTAPTTRQGPIRLVARAVDAEGDQLVLVTGERLVADAVVWATGHRPHYPWLQLPVLDECGAPIHAQGITDVPGLAFLGGAGRDAARLTAALGRQLAGAR